MSSYCPFANSECRDDCTFKTHATATADGVKSCLIAIKLSHINENQDDQLSEIRQTIQR